MSLDIRTLAILLGVASLIEAVAIFSQYLINKNYEAVKWWAQGFALIALAFILIILRDIISIALVAIVAANAIHFLGIMFLYIGIRLFLGKKINRGRMIFLFAAFVAAVAYFTYVDNDVSSRVVVISAFMAALTLRAAFVLFTGKLKSIVFSANFTSATFLIIGSFFIVRLLVTLTVAPQNNYFTPTPLQVSMFLVVLITTLLLTFGLIIMVNQRLSSGIKETNEGFEMIFNTNSDSAMVARFRDGVVVNVNDGFVALSGFSREEVIGKRMTDIDFWNDPADLQKIIGEMKEKGSCENYEMVCKLKNGDTRIGLLSAKIIRLQGMTHVASFTRDITERKLAEKTLEEERERLKRALAEVKTLRGIVPICANCKKIRDDRGYWNQVERYVSAHSEAEFSHGICPDCMKKLYPEYVADINALNSKNECSDTGAI